MLSKINSLVRMAREGLPAHLKRLLAILYCDSLSGKPSNLQSIAKEFSIRNEHAQQICREARAFEFITNKDSNYELTKKGRSSIKVVMVGGVFNIIHAGHLHTLRAAKELGDVLVVSIATDKTVRTTRGKEPLIPEQERVKLVDSVKYVDAALVGSERNIFDTVMKVRPDVIAIGYDQKHDETALSEEAGRRGLAVKVVRLSSPIPEIKTSKITSTAEATSEF